MALRTTLGFALAPAVIPALAYAYAHIRVPTAELDRVGITYALLFVASYSLALVVGVPSHIYLQKRGWVALRHYMLAGAAVGAVPVMVLAAAGRGLASGLLEPLGFGVLCGALSGLMFWLLVIARSDNVWPNNTLE